MARDERREPPLEWVLVRRTAAFDVLWYLLKLWDFGRMIPDDAAGGATFLSVVGLEAHQRIRVMQLEEMTDDTSGPAVVLTGARVFALIAPELRSANGGGRRSRGIDATPPMAPVSTERPAPEPQETSIPDEFGRSRDTQEFNTLGVQATALRLEAAAYVNAPRRVIPEKNFTLELGLTSTAMPDVEGGRDRD